MNKVSFISLLNPAELAHFAKPQGFTGAELVGCTSIGTLMSTDKKLGLHDL